MLVLKVQTDENVVLRDAAGRVLCRFTMFEYRRPTESERGQMRLGFVAPDDVEINREVVDRRKYPAEYAAEGKVSA